MAGAAVARLKIGVSSFYEMTPVELHYAYKYCNQYDESAFKQDYEVARYIVKHIWNSQGRCLKKLLNEPKDVETFPWESKEQKVQSLKEMKAALQSWALHFKAKEKKNKKKKP